LCFFSQYVLLFGVGILARRRNWLARIPHDFGMRWFWVALVGGSLIWAAALIAIVVVTHTEKSVDGGFTWQSAVICLWESFFCLGVCLGLIVLFRERFNRQGRFAKWMSDNCFAVYVFHAPVLIAVTLGMRGFMAPKPVKFLVAAILGTIATYLASSLVFRRVPLLRRVL
jgi:glucan biosynthesis protein C